MNEKNIKIKFKKFYKYFKDLKKLSKINNINLVFLCIKFVLNQRYFDKLIFGFDTLGQLKEIIRNINSKKKIPHQVKKYIKNIDLGNTLPDPRDF